MLNDEYPVPKSSMSTVNPNRCSFPNACSNCGRLSAYAFGDFQSQSRGRKFIPFYQVDKIVAEVRVVEFQTRYVDRQGDRGNPAAFHGSEKAADFFSDVAIEADDEAAVLEKGKKLSRRDKTFVGMAPADEGLAADKSARGKVENGLDERFELPLFERTFPFGFHCVLCDERLVHVGVVQGESGVVISFDGTQRKRRAVAHDVDRHRAVRYFVHAEVKHDLMFRLRVGEGKFQLRCQIVAQGHIFGQA